MSDGHHPIFDQYSRWAGHVPAGWDVNFLGVRTRRSFVTSAPGSFSGEAVASYPEVNEEYFEWIDLLESVQSARQRFTMIELGAGYGRWLVNGGAAARLRGLQELRLIGVEAEPTHFRWMKEHCESNNLRRSEVRLIRAAVSGDDGWVRFHVGDSMSWYGQAIDTTRPETSVPGRLRSAVARRRGRFGQRSIERVRAISLRTLLREMGYVDLIDADVQGSEADVFEPAAEAVDRGVARVHIGTHSLDNEQRLRELFTSLGWHCMNDFPSLEESKTRWGRVQFGDGVQTWINPALAPHAS